MVLVEVEDRCVGDGTRMEPGGPVTIIRRSGLVQSQTQPNLQWSRRANVRRGCVIEPTEIEHTSDQLLPNTFTRQRCMPWILR